MIFCLYPRGSVNDYPNDKETAAMLAYFCTRSHMIAALPGPKGWNAMLVLVTPAMEKSTDRGRMQ